MPYTNVLYLPVVRMAPHQTPYTLQMFVACYCGSTHAYPFSYHICHNLNLARVSCSSSLVLCRPISADRAFPPLYVCKIIQLFSLLHFWYFCESHDLCPSNLYHITIYKLPMCALPLLGSVTKKHIIFIKCTYGLTTTDSIQSKTLFVGPVKPHNSTWAQYPYL